MSHTPFCRVAVHKSVLRWLAFVLLFGALFAKAQAQSSPVANARIENQASASYRDNLGQLATVQSNTVVTVVLQVGSYSLTPSQSSPMTRLGDRGSTVYFPYSLRNTGNGPDVFNINVAELSTGSNFDRIAVYLDDGTGLPASTTALCSVTTAGNNCSVDRSLGAGDAFNFVVAYTLPGNADATWNQNTATVTVKPKDTTTSWFSSYTQTNADKSEARTDTVRFSAAAIFQVQKALTLPAFNQPDGTAWPNNPSGPRPSSGLGAETTFTITFRNTGGGAGTLYLRDAIPSGLTYKGGSAVLSCAPGTALTDGTGGDNSLCGGGIEYEFDGTAKVIHLRIPSLAAGSVGTLSFIVQPNSTAGTASSSVFSGTQGLSATLTQRAPAGWPQVPASISCVDANGSANGNGTGNLASVSQATASLSSAAMRAGADITCTFTNARNGISGVVFNDGGAPSAGSNTGTPNDGLRNGNEAGLGGVTVALTNCNGTVHASTVTDGQGAYALNVPSQLAGGVCVSVSLPAGYQSTGANAGGTPLPVDTPTTVGGVGLTYQTSSPSVHQVAFAVPGPSALVLDFGQVPLSSFSGDTQRAVMAGLNADHLQRFRAGTGGVLSVSLLASQAVPSGSESAWSSAVFLDASCSGRYQPGASLLSAAGYNMTVIQGQEVCMVTRVSAPASAQTGHSHSVPIRALIQLSNSSLQASFTVNSQTRVGNSAVQLRKEVRNVTAGHVAWSENNQGKRGDELEYRVSFTNMGAAPVTDLEVHDTTGPWTTLVSAGAESLPSGLSCSLISPANGSRSNCSPGVSGGKGSISWFFDGPLLPQASGSVLYRVRID